MLIESSGRSRWPRGIATPSGLSCSTRRPTTRSGAGPRWSAGELVLWMRRPGVLREPSQDVAEPFALHIAGDWLAAAEAWERIGCPYEQAEALGDGDEPAMRAALAIFARLGAEPAA